MDVPAFRVMALQFTNPDDIAPAIQGFLETQQPEDIISVTHFIVAVQKPPKVIGTLSTAGGQPTTEYQFRYIIIYV